MNKSEIVERWQKLPKWMKLDQFYWLHPEKTSGESLQAQQRNPEYLKIKMRVAVRDDFTCQVCGAKPNPIELIAFTDHWTEGVKLWDIPENKYHIRCLKCSSMEF